MEHVKPGYVAPVYPVQPMPAPAPAPMPMPMPQPVAPIMNKPVHNDIHLHASYQQTSIMFPTPKPAVVAAVAPAAVVPYSSAGSILVLFILLVIITRGFIRKC